MNTWVKGWIAVSAAMWVLIALLMLMDETSPLSDAEGPWDFIRTLGAAAVVCLFVAGAFTGVALLFRWAFA